MSALELVIAIVVVFWAYIVRGIAGFGSALAAVPLLGLIAPLPVVVPVVVALDLMGSASQAVQNRSEIVWPDLYPLIPFTLIGIGGALTLYSMLNPTDLAVALGFFVIVYAVYQVLPLPELRASRVIAIPYGMLGGLIGTMFGTGGPFYIMYLGMRGLPKGALRASFAAYFVADGGVRLLGFAAFGHLTIDSFILFAVGIPSVFLALRIGERIHIGLEQRQFKQLMSVLLVCSGIALIAKAGV